jgi:hypothetical protein
MPFDLSTGLEQIRPWLLLAFNGGLLTIAAKLYVDRRTLMLAEKSRGESFQLKVSADGRNNLQFIIDNLVRDITAQREQTEAQATAHAHCQEQLSAMLTDNRGLESKLDGICRQFIAFSESVGRAIPPGNRSPEINNMMEQLAALAAVARDEAAG